MSNQCVSLKVMAKSRIGHLVEAEVLQAIGVDYIDECVGTGLQGLLLSVL